MNAQELIEKYVEIRDAGDEITKEYRERMVRISNAKTKIEKLLMESMEAEGCESIRTTAGTCYRSMHTSVKVEDREAFLQYVQDNEAWDLLESRAAKKAVEEFIEENQDIPPGLSVRRDAFVGIRRA